MLSSLNKTAFSIRAALLLALFAAILLPMQSALASPEPIPATLCVEPSGAGGCYTTIQAAIDAAADGDTITVAAGTYTGTLNIVGRSNLTIVGADAATTIIQPTTTLPWNVESYGISRQTVLRVVDSTGITVSGLTFDLDLVKGNFKYVGLYHNSTGTVSGNILKNNQVADISGGYYELGLALRAPTYTDAARAAITVSGNTFQDLGRVSLHIGKFVNATVTGNIFLKTANDFGYAIELGTESTGTISGNIFHGFDTPALSDGSTSAAIYVENCFTSAQVSPITKNVTISDNEIYGNQWGMYIGNEFNGYAGNVDIVVNFTGNNVHDNTDGGVYIADEDKAAGSSVTVTGSGNTVTNNVGYGYYINTYGDGDITVNLTGETVTGQATGMYVEDQGVSSTSLYNISLTSSDLSGNTTYGVNNTVTGFTVDASNNWWGSDFGPDDPIGTTEVPVVPEPSVTDMLNAAPAGLLGVGVSEYVDYYPFTSEAPLAFSPDPVTFAGQLLNTTSPNQTVTITNNGALDVVVTSVSTTGDFAIANNTCTTIVPAGTCTFDVNFTPTATGARLGEVTIISDAASSPDIIALSGNGAANMIMHFRSIGANDGTVIESAKDSGVGGYKESTSAFISVGDDYLRRQSVGILDFNTYAIPDTAVITGVRLRVKVSAIGSGAYARLGELTADVVKPRFGNYLTLETRDFQSVPLFTGIGTFTRATSVNYWISMNVNPATLTAINRLGHTQFRLHFQKKYYADAIKQYISFLSGNHSVLTNRPQLIIFYYIP